MESKEVNRVNCFYRYYLFYLKKKLDDKAPADFHLFNLFYILIC